MKVLEDYTQSTYYRKLVFNAVGTLGEATPKQIWRYIHNVEKAKVNRQYLTLSDEGKEKKVKRKIPTDRTVDSWLKRLTNGGDLVKNNGVYSLHDRVRTEYRYFGGRFGRLALSMVMNAKYPGTHTLEENTKSMVSSFGSYVVYCLIEAMRSFDLLDGAEGTDYDVDKRISAWLEDVFDPATMLIYFISALKYQATDKEVTQYRKSLGKKSIKEIGFSYLPFIDVDKEKPILLDPDNPKYALKEKTLSQMLRILEKTHPEHLKHMKMVKERMLLELHQDINVED